MKLSAAVLLLVAAFALVGRDGFAQSQTPAGPPPQLEGFVSVDTLPPSEQLPAARFLVIAYAFVWLAVFGYLWSIWTRLGKVQGELEQLAKRTGTKVR